MKKEMIIKIHEEVKKALDKVGSEYNVDLKLGGHTTMDSTGFTTKLNCVEQVDGKSGEQVKFEQYCGMWDLSKEDFGAKFKYDGEKYTISGIKPRATKYPILADNEEGTTYKFRASDVRDNLIKE